MVDFLTDPAIRQALQQFGLDADHLVSLPDLTITTKSIIEEIYHYEEQQKFNQENAATKGDRFSYIRAWPIERDTGQFIFRLAQACKPQLILECGTSFGLSTLHWSDALKLNGDGKIITVEVSKLKHAPALVNFQKAHLEDLIHQERLAFDQYLKNCQTDFDIIFLDCDRKRYAFYLDYLEPMLRVGGFIVADNAIDRGEDMLAFKQKLQVNPQFISATLPIGDGLLLAQKVA